MEPLYLVSSVHRSGSSMLMRLLKEGGLDPIYNPASDSMNNIIGDYTPNPNGFFQFTSQIDETFYELYKGKLIKCPIRELLNLPEGNYKVVINQRNPEEIRMSMRKWTPYQDWGKDEILTYLYEEFMNTLISKLQEREDINLTILSYNKIVDNPEEQFQKLVDNGWPLDISLMTKDLYPELYRNKIL